MEAIPVTLLDYGVGNIHSLRKAFEQAGAAVSVETDLRSLAQSRCVLLPGVGAFGKVASQIGPGRIELRARLDEGMPLLAVCIGMQVLYDSSEEGEGEGIGWFEGRIRRLAHARLPHIGWNSVKHDGTGPFAGLPPEPFFYFVHSYAPSACGGGCVATADYGGRFAAAAVRGNAWAVQFHPEKSSDAGRRVIENFLALARERR